MVPDQKSRFERIWIDNFSLWFLDCGEGSASPLRTRTFSTADMEPIQLEGCAGGYFCHPQVPVLTYHSSVSDPGLNWIRIQIMSGSRQAKISCLKCLLLGWRLLEPKVITYNDGFWSKLIFFVIKNFVLDPDSATGWIRIQVQQKEGIRIRNIAYHSTYCTSCHTVFNLTWQKMKYKINRIWTMNIRCNT